MIESLAMLENLLILHKLCGSAIFWNGKPELQVEFIGPTQKV